MYLWRMTQTNHTDEEKENHHIDLESQLVISSETIWTHVSMFEKAVYEHTKKKLHTFF